MSLFPEWSRLGGFRTLTEVRQYYRLPDEAWAIVVRVIGDPGDDIRFFGALPRSAIVGGATSAQYDDGTNLSPVAATQVGLMWRLSRMILACKAGVADTDFVDEDPWASQPQTGANFPPVPPTGTAPASSGVKERVLKMASLIDQQDESELLPATNNELNQWTQNFINVMGALPERSEEPTGSQLAALAKRTIQQGNSPYCDFAVWVPFERRMSKTQKCRVYHPLAGGGYLVKDLPGPGSHLAWLASWRVFKTAAVMLRIATLASLQIYERTIERIHAQWPSAWGLLYEAEDRARAEQLDRETPFHSWGICRATIAIGLGQRQSLVMSLQNHSGGCQLLGRVCPSPCSCMGGLRTKGKASSCHRSANTEPDPGRQCFTRTRWGWKLT